MKYKSKPRKGLMKRMKVTATGKILYHHVGKAKLLSKKTRRRKRKLKRPGVITGAVRKWLKQIVVRE